MNQDRPHWKITLWSFWCWATWHHYRYQPQVRGRVCERCLDYKPGPPGGFYIGHH